MIPKLPLRTAAADIGAATTADELRRAVHAAHVAASAHVAAGIAGPAADADSYARDILNADETEDTAAEVAELADLLDEAASAAGEYTSDEEDERDVAGVVMLDAFTQSLGGSPDPDGDPWTPLRPDDQG